MIIQNPILTGSVALNGLNLTATNLATTSSNSFTSDQSITGSLGISANTTIAGTLTVTGSIVGLATSASYVLNAVSSSKALSASYSDTASFANSFTVMGNLTVFGTQSVQYITSSQLNVANNVITVNVGTPGIRFGGLSVYDSGSTAGATGSLFWDSFNNNWVYQQVTGSTYTGGMLISGPRNFAGLGNEQGTTSGSLMKGQGGDHMTSSAIFEDGYKATFYNTSLVVSSSGNVGIGTSTPTDNIIGASLTMLDITGASGGALKLHHSTTTYGEFSFYKGTNGSFIDSAGASTAANNDLIFRTGRTGSNYTVLEAMRITNSGSVGIGTTNPSYTLDVSGTGRFTSALQMGSSSQVIGNGLLKLGIASGNSGAALQFLGWAGSYRNWQIDTAYINAAFNITPSTTNAGSTFTTPAFTITSDSNIGIGIGSPNIAGFGGRVLTIAAPSNSESAIELYGSITTDDVIGALAYSNVNASSDKRVAQISSFREGGNDAANLRFYTKNGTSLGERMRIGITGDADIRIGGNYSNHATANRGTININGTSTAMISLSTGATTNKGYIYHNGNYMEVWNVDNSYLAFGANNGERMRLTPAGDICAIRNVLGIVGSYRNLSFGAAGLMARDAYDSYFVGNLYYDSGGWKLKYGSYYGNCVNWYDGQYSFQTSTTNGAVDSTVALTSTLFLDRSGNAVFKGSVTQNGSPSDINLKENLVKITSPLEKISQINGYNFDWKEGTAANGLAIPVAEGMQAPESPLSIAHDAGLIAQEVEAIMPQLVRDNGHKALNYNGIIALLVEGIKELKAEIEELKNK